MLGKITGKELMAKLEKQLATDYDCKGSDYDPKPGAMWKGFPLCGLTYGERDGCVNENSPVWRDDVNEGVIELFYSYYKVIRDQLTEDFAIKYQNEYLRIVVQPDLEDTTAIVLFLQAKHKVIYCYDTKAWHFSWENADELATALEMDYNEMYDRVKECAHFTLP
jgi:hypothetical protein